MKRGLVPLVLLIVLAGAAGGFLLAHLTGRHGNEAYLDTGPPPIPPAAATATAPGDAGNGGAADAGTGGKHPFPTAVPDIALPDLSGRIRHLKEWQGHLLLINFWATWCEPCRREIPLLRHLRREQAAQGIEVVGVAVDFRDAVRKYAQDMGIEYPVLVGEKDGLNAINAFGMDAVFPFTVFVDRQGRIITLKVGELHADEAGLILDRIEAVDQGHLGQAEARQQINTGIRSLALKRAQSDPEPHTH